MTWIDIDKRPPKHNEYVLVNPPYVSDVFDDEPRHVLRWDDNRKRFKYYLGDSVHDAFRKGQSVSWMGLPEYYCGGFPEGISESTVTTGYVPPDLLHTAKIALNEIISLQEQLENAMGLPAQINVIALMLEEAIEKAESIGT